MKTNYAPDAGGTIIFAADGDGSLDDAKASCGAKCTGGHWERVKK